MRSDALCSNQMSYPVYDGARFAGTCSGENQLWSVTGLYSQLLRSVQFRHEAEKLQAVLNRISGFIAFTMFDDHIVVGGEDCIA